MSNAFRYEPQSSYVTSSFYDWLTEVSVDWNRAIVRKDPIDEMRFRAVSHLLFTEARLLDQQAFDTWLGLYVDECAYWIPSDRPASDPRAAITLEFHDRRRLLDRIVRLQTGFAYSQLPASRTSRQIGGLEVWQSPLRQGDWHARYNFSLAESRNGETRLLSGWNGFVLRETAGGVALVVKQINLIDCDLPQGNNSFFL